MALIASRGPRPGIASYLAGKPPTTRLPAAFDSTRPPFGGRVACRVTRVVREANRRRDRR